MNETLQWMNETEQEEKLNHLPVKLLRSFGSKLLGSFSLHLFIQTLCNRGKLPHY